MDKTLREYSETSTIHGIGYIFQPGISVVERIVWILVVLLHLAIAIFLAIVAYVSWKENQVLTTVQTTGHPVEEVEFPAITICAQV